MGVMRIIKLFVLWVVIVILMAMISAFVFGLETPGAPNGLSLWILGLIVTYVIRDKIK